jgi:hypothetical protein
MTDAQRIAAWQGASARATVALTEARERNIRACRARRERLRAAGMCIFDGRRPAAPPSPLCAECRAKQNTQSRERRRIAVALFGERTGPRPRRGRPPKRS